MLLKSKKHVIRLGRPTAPVISNSLKRLGIKNMELWPQLIGGPACLRAGLAQRARLARSAGLTFVVISSTTHDWRGPGVSYSLEVVGTRRLTSAQLVLRDSFLSFVAQVAKAAALNSHIVDIVACNGRAFIVYYLVGSVEYTNNALELVMRLTELFPSASSALELDEESEDEPVDLMDEVLLHYQLPEMGLNEEHDYFVEPVRTSPVGLKNLQYYQSVHATELGGLSLLNSADDQLEYIRYWESQLRSLANSVGVGRAYTTGLQRWPLYRAYRARAAHKVDYGWRYTRLASSSIECDWQDTPVDSFWQALTSDLFKDRAFTGSCGRTRRTLPDLLYSDVAVAPSNNWWRTAFLLQRMLLAGINDLVSNEIVGRQGLDHVHDLWQAFGYEGQIMTNIRLSSEMLRLLRRSPNKLRRQPLIKDAIDWFDGLGQFISPLPLVDRDFEDNRDRLSKMVEWRPARSLAGQFVIRPVNLSLCPIVDQQVSESEDEAGYEEGQESELNAEDEVELDGASFISEADWSAIDKSEYEPGVFVWYYRYFVKKLKTACRRFDLSRRSVAYYWGFSRTLVGLTIGGRAVLRLPFDTLSRLGQSLWKDLGLFSQYYSWWHWEEFRSLPWLAPETGVSVIAEPKVLDEGEAPKRRRKADPEEVYREALVSFIRGAFGRLLWAAFNKRVGTRARVARSVHPPLSSSDARQAPVSDSEVPDWLYISHLHAGDTMPDMAEDREIIIEPGEPGGKKVVVGKVPGSHAMAVTRSYRLRDELTRPRTERDNSSTLSPGQIIRRPVPPTTEQADEAELVVRRVLDIFSSVTLWDAIGPARMAEWMEPAAPIPDIPDMSLAIPYRHRSYGSLVELEENILSLVPNASERKSVFSVSGVWRAAERRRYVKRVVMGILPFSGSGVEQAEIEDVLSSRGWGLTSALWWRGYDGALSQFASQAWKLLIADNMLLRTRLSSYSNTLARTGRLFKEFRAQDSFDVIYSDARPGWEFVSAEQTLGQAVTVNSALSRALYSKSLAFAESDEAAALFADRRFGAAVSSQSHGDQIDKLVAAPLAPVLVRSLKQSLGPSIDTFLVNNGLWGLGFVVKKAHYEFGLGFSESRWWERALEVGHDEWLTDFGAEWLSTASLGVTGGKSELWSMFINQQQVKWHDELLLRLGAVADYASYKDDDLIEEARRISPSFGEFIAANFKTPAELRELVGESYRKRILASFLGEAANSGFNYPTGSEDLNEGFFGMDDIVLGETPETVSLSDLYMWERTVDEWLHTNDETRPDQRGGTALEIDVAMKLFGVYRTGPFHRLVRAPTKRQSKTAKWKKKSYTKRWHWFPMVPTYYRPNTAGFGPSHFVKRAPVVEGTPMGMSNPPPRAGWHFVSWEKANRKPPSFCFIDIEDLIDLAAGLSLPVGADISAAPIDPNVKDGEEAPILVVDDRVRRLYRKGRAVRAAILDQHRQHAAIDASEGGTSAKPRRSYYRRKLRGHYSMELVGVEDVVKYCASEPTSLLPEPWEVLDFGVAYTVEAPHKPKRKYVRKPKPVDGSVVPAKPKRKYVRKPKPVDGSVVPAKPKRKYVRKPKPVDGSAAPTRGS